MAGADTKLTVEADTSGAIRSVKSLETAFASLKTQLLGLGIGAAVLQANQFALALDQASRASGVALGTVTSFARAVSSLGGDANRAAGDVLDFVIGLDAAKKGSASAQIDLQRLGISLSDLGSKSNQAIFEQTVKSIAAIGDASERNRLAVQMLGRSFKDIDVRDVAKAMGTGGGMNTGDIRAAAEAQKSLAINLGSLQAALLEVARPLNEIVAKTRVTKDEFVGLMKIVGMLAVSLLAFGKVNTLLSSAIVGLAYAPSKLGKAFSGMSAALTVAGQGIGNTLMVFRNFLMNGTVSATAMGIAWAGLAGSIGLVLKVLLRFAGIAGLVYTAIEALSFIEKFFLKTDYIDSFFESIAKGIEWVARAIGVVIPGFTALANNAEASRKGLTSTAGAGRGGNAQTLADQQARGEEMRKLAEEEAAAKRKVVDAFRAQRLEQEKIIAGYKLEINSGLRQLDFQNTLIGKTQEEQDKKSKLFELETTYIGKINEILAKQAELKAAAAVGTKEEGAAYAAYSATVQSTISKLAEQYGIQVSAATKLIDRGQGLALLEKDRQNTLERITAQMEAQNRISEAMTSARLKMGSERQDLSFQRGLIGFGNLTKQRLTIVEESRKAGNEAARAYASAFEGDDLTAEQSRQFADGLKAIEEGYAEIRDLQLSNLAASQEFSAGWREAFQNYADEAENSARQASDYFSTFTKGWEDAIVNFVRTGKLSFKDLANSMIAEFAKIQAQKMFVQLFGGAGNAGGGLLGSLFGGLFGKAGGGAVNAGQPYMVGESGRELFVPNSAGKIIPSGMGGGSTNVTYNINATDAQSFRTMIARDPQFIYNITEAGRRSQPSRRLA
jgi:lambda family phage tail tape measure protein